MSIRARKVCGYGGTGASHQRKVLYLTLRRAGLESEQPWPCGVGFSSCQRPAAQARQAFSPVIGHHVCVFFF